MEEGIPDGKSDGGVPLPSALSLLLLGICHIHQVVTPPLFVSAGVHLRLRYPDCSQDWE